MSSSLLALLDDITTILDDVAVMTKVATQKTAGVLGDDLALNAQQVSGVKPDRELPVVWAVAKGSMLNKAILVPAALAISFFFPGWVIVALMMVGGAFLCFEGVEKMVHKYLHSKAEDDAHHRQLVQAVADDQVDLVAHEKGKISGAIRTDFILSAEIIVISLGAVAEKEFLVQVGVLIAIAIVMTIGVYGIVAGIVKLDDAGLYLVQRRAGAARALGRAILAMAPWLMKFLSVAGTLAMFLVGGGILVHGITPLHHAVDAASAALPLGWLVKGLCNVVIGVVVGAIVLAVVKGIVRLRGRKPAPH